MTTRPSASAVRAAAVATTLGLALSESFFFVAIAAPRNCSSSSSPWQDSVFFVVIVATIAAGVATAIAGVLGRRRGRDGTIGWAIAFGLLTPLVCGVLFLLFAGGAIAACAN